NGDSGTVSVLLGRGDGTFGARNFQVGGAPGLLTVGDFNGDGRQDVAVAKGGTLSVLLGKGNGGFQLAVDTEIGGSIRSLGVADFNEDGLQDLAVGTCEGDVFGFCSGFILLATEDGSFQISDGPGGFSLAADDFNGDGHQDLAVGS